MGKETKKPRLAIKEIHLVAEHLETCAKWNFEEWGNELGFSYQSSLERIRQNAFSLEGEVGIVALWDNIPVGMGHLEKTGADEHRRLTPWISGVYVIPEYRGRGIAKAMITVIEDLAYDAGFDQLYLHTPNAEGLYQKSGWLVIDTFERKTSGTHVVMRKTLV